jgi:hypothetical protein
VKEEKNRAKRRLKWRRMGGGKKNSFKGKRSGEEGMGRV